MALGKLHSLVVARNGSAVDLVSLEVRDFTHGAGASTVSALDKIDLVGTPNDMYRVNTFYPSTALPADSLSIQALLNSAVALIDVKYGSSEGLTAPGAPTIGTATKTGATTATVAFTAPVSNGGSPITGYTAVSTPGGITGTGTSSPISMTGLTSATEYTFTVTATNALGTSAASAASNAITTD